jgi:hypothetical protein
MAVLGRRHWYRYDSDDGKSYKILTLDYLAEAAGLELDDTVPTLPRGYEPRYVWMKEVDPSRPGRPMRKKLILQRKDVQRFRQSSPIEVAGIKMIPQGYIGESRRGMGRNDNVISEVRVEITNDK